MRLINIVLLASASALALFAVHAHSQSPDGKVTDQFRRDYIKNFKRTGLNTAPGDAMFLRILVESGRYKRGIEVGSASGFGAINMGIAFERNGGHLFTLDIDPDMIRATREHVKNMGLDNTVTAVEGDALKTIPSLQGEFDFIFIDALKQDYLKYLQAALPKLKPNALIVADNVIQSARQMRDFLEFVQNEKEFDTVIIRSSMEKNDGMSVSYKLK